MKPYSAVPKKPTEEMIDKGGSAIYKALYPYGATFGEVVDCEVAAIEAWRAMIKEWEDG